MDNARVRKVTAGGIISTIAGNGTPGASGDGGLAVNASLSDVSGIAVDKAGVVYIADSSNRRVRRVTPDGTITTVAGNGVQGFSGDGGLATEAMLGRPVDVAVDAAGNLYIADSVNQRIRRVDTNGFITTIAGNGLAGYSGDGGLATHASMQFPVGLTVDQLGNVYFADGNNNRIRKVSASGVITTVAGGGTGRFSGDGGTAIAAALDVPEDVAIDSAGNLYIADAGNNRVRRVDSTGTITTIAGTGEDGFSGDDGSGLQAMLNFPWGLALDASGNVYVADRVNNRIRRITVASTTAPPSIESNAVVNGASFTANQAVAPGAIVSIFGTNLSANDAGATSGTLPTAIGDTSVTFNSTAAPLFFVSPKQVNAQVPFTTGRGTASVQVHRGNLSSSIIFVNIASVSPGIFITDPASAAGAVLHADFRLVDDGAPAKPGETLLIYATGLGALIAPMPSGQPASSAVATLGMPSVTMGGLAAQVSFSGLAPGFVGLYQVNAVVPMGAQPGHQPLQISMDGVSSNIATIALSN